MADYLFIFRQPDIIKFLKTSIFWL